MPSISEVFESGETLKAADILPNVDVPCIIKSVQPKKFDDGSKLIISFVNKIKVLICNKTNARAIADLHGEDYSIWPDKTIFLRQAQTDFQGQIVPCIRVSLNPPAVPASQLPQPAPQGVDQQRRATEYQQQHNPDGVPF
jgi:hypothetical protein